MSFKVHSMENRVDDIFYLSRFSGLEMIMELTRGASRCTVTFSYLNSQQVPKLDTMNLNPTKIKLGELEIKIKKKRTNQSEISYGMENSKSNANLERKLKKSPEIPVLLRLRV